MVHITRMVMQGFKSFAKRTEIQFDKGINVVLGPNGSGKSNVSDALCFALGRLSIKSMRAAKAKNLLFMGSKYVKPAREASVELVFDNRDRLFGLESDEVSLTRIVRANGQGIYKINGETKTRLEVIEILAQAGIDPYGFNMVLQGQIQAIVKMHPEERRKIIEEVAGIAIYESRKEKSLKELEKTDERLKEITAILRERTAYLKNLEHERQQALKFKDLELTVRRCKASLLTKRKIEKEKEGVHIDRSIGDKTTQKDAAKVEGVELQAVIDALGEQSNQISRQVQQATGLEQEQLHTHIANLRAELEGMKVRKEGYEQRRLTFERRIQELQRASPALEAEIAQLASDAPGAAQKAEELTKKKQELGVLEEARKKVQATKSELQHIRERWLEREKTLSRTIAFNEALVRQLEEGAAHLVFQTAEACSSFIHQGKAKLSHLRIELESIAKETLRHEKLISVAEIEMERSLKLTDQVANLDVCPLCRTTITSDHKQHVRDEANTLANQAEKQRIASTELLQRLLTQRSTLAQELTQLEQKLHNAEVEQIRHHTLQEKHQQLKKNLEEEKLIRHELQTLEHRRIQLEEKGTDSSALEEKYSAKMLEIEELSARTSQDMDKTLFFKKRELEQMHVVIKQALKDREEAEKEIGTFSTVIESKQKQLHEKETQEKELQARFKQLFAEREEKQRVIQVKTAELSEAQSGIRAIEEQINYLKIGKAKVDAEREAVEMELIDFTGLEIIQGSVAYLEERLGKAQESLNHIGSVNQRALEVYDEVKHSYDEVYAKVQVVEKEKLDILSIVAEIDKKKRTSFMRTFRAMNELFTQNFAQLYTKGTAYLELENQEDIFAGGVQIIVRLAKGKYFDATSLSGGEQTLVALSLLFAIQEYKPYHFYVFDEIDAALDKRNSERLAALLVKYMKQGQYIVITHNDAIIMQAQVLYGVSMHDNVSKVLSLNIQEATAEAKRIEEQVEQQQMTGKSVPESTAPIVEV
ncbi:chromosome segregation protein SMC [Candidatus Pacearchaeota archaeon]|nr:chromosome segregation protein SMC [Candidatus Pacearchaeota archaeon]